jgi:protein-disulfide isomerase
MSRKEWGSQAITGLMVLCAVLVTGMAVRRQFFSTPSAAAAGPPPPREIRDWKRLAEAGQLLGAADARVTIVEFSDFQCPFCATLSRTIRSMQQRDPSVFRVVYRHYPLAQHTHAAAAGVAAECAAQQRRFGEYHDVLFANQDSIGTRPWTRFAANAGVADTVAFKRCMAAPAAKARVDEDARAAARLRLPGTPSLIVNGRLYSGGVTEEELSALISASR